MKTQCKYQGLEPTLSAKFLTSAKYFSRTAQSTTLKSSEQTRSTTGFTLSTPLKKTLDANPSQNPNSLFPRGLEQALSSESCNIAKFKKRIQKQKNYLNQFMNSLSLQISHIIEDLKLSLFAKLEIQYQTFLSQYSHLKNQIEGLQAQQKMARMDSAPSLITTPVADNKELIMEMKRLEDEYKNRHIRSRIVEMDPHQSVSLQRLVSHILLVSRSNEPLINQQVLRSRTQQLKSIINRYVEPLYGDLDSFIQRKQLSQPQLTSISSNFEQIQYTQKITYQSLPIVQQTPHKPSHSNHSTKSLKYQQPQKFMVVSPQNLVVQQANDIKIYDNFCVRSLHTDKTLCCVGFKNQIITGGKDSIVTVNSLDGEKVVTLRGHKSSVCCITILKSGSRTFVASGGDLGCGALIVWEAERWGMLCQVPAHTAAISCIVDSGDGETLVTSSYDKSIKIINYLKGEVVFSQNCQKPVISLAINTSKTRIVSTDLSEIISVWEVKLSNKILSGLKIKNRIQNDCINSIVLFSMTNKETIVCGDQHGFIKLWNTETGGCINSYKCHEFLVVDMILLDRLSNKNSPLIVSIGKRDKFLTLTNTSSHKIRRINLENEINIELGCGIGPKMFMIQSTPTLSIGLVSQSESKKQVEICELQLE